MSATLHFYDWSAGHHQQRPASIELPDIALALPICRAIAAAISQPGSARAAIVSEDRMVDNIYITDDYVDGDVPADLHQWSQRPLIVYGAEAELDAIASEELREAVEDCLWQWPEPTIWDGRGYLGGGDFVLTTLTAEEIAELAETSECHIVAAIVRPAADVLTELRAAADELAKEDAAS